MGINQSSSEYHPKSERNPPGVWTIDSVLTKMSIKIKELQDTIHTMQKKPKKMPDGVARDYLLSLLGTVGKELSEMEATLSTMFFQGYGSPQSGTYSALSQTATHSEGKKSLLQRIQESTEENEKLREDINTLQEQNVTNKNIIDGFSKKNKEYKSENEKLNSDVKSLKKEKEELIMRLSKFTADKLTADNPNIADLSDPNRPTKLVEMMSELYDNEWTEAFEALQKGGYDDRKAIRILFQTFLDIYSFCKTKSSGLLSLTDESAKDLFEDIDKTVKEQDRITKNKCGTVLTPKRGKETAFSWNPIYLEWRDEKVESELERSATYNVKAGDIRSKLESELKKVKKDVGSAMVPLITKAYLQQRWHKSCLGALKPYIKKCLYVTWMMRVQTPPMAIAALPKQGEALDQNLYTVYSKRGQKIDFVVWPAMLLKEPQFSEAPVVMKKGVAEPKEATDKDTGGSRKQ